MRLDLLYNPIGLHFLFFLCDSRNKFLKTGGSAPLSVVLLWGRGKFGHSNPHTHKVFFNTTLEKKLFNSQSVFVYNSYSIRIRHYSIKSILIYCWNWWYAYKPKIGHIVVFRRPAPYQPCTVISSTVQSYHPNPASLEWSYMLRSKTILRPSSSSSWPVWE